MINRALLVISLLVAAAPLRADELDEASFPDGIELSFRQLSPIAEGRVEIGASIRSTSAAVVTLDGMFNPLSECSNTRFYFMIIVNGVGMRVPQYATLCYRAQDLVLEPGAEVTGSRVFESPALKIDSAEDALVQFLWMEINTKYDGKAGVIELH